jgi:hypothetical protein
MSKLAVPRSIQVILIATAVVATAVAVARELAQDTADRTWHGRVFGIPYDFRPPTPSRIRSSHEATVGDHLIVPRTFGLGWSINVRKLKRVFGRARQQ